MIKPALKPSLINRKCFRWVKGGFGKQWWFGSRENIYLKRGSTSDRIGFGGRRGVERERENLPGRDYYFTISPKKKEPRRVHKSEGLLNEINQPDDKHSPVRFTFYTFFKRSYIPPSLSLLSKPNDLSTLRLNLRERWRHHGVFYR